MEILLITAKTDFCSLIFQMLASYIAHEGPKDFYDILTWQIERKLIILIVFSRTLPSDRSLILLNIISCNALFKTFDHKFFWQP